VVFRGQPYHAAILHQRHFSEAAPFIREYHYLPVM